MAPMLPDQPAELVTLTTSRFPAVGLVEHTLTAHPGATAGRLALVAGRIPAAARFVEARTDLQVALVFVEDSDPVVSPAAADSTPAVPDVPQYAPARTGRGGWAVANLRTGRKIPVPDGGHRGAQRLADRLNRSVKARDGRVARALAPVGGVR